MYNNSEEYYYQQMCEIEVEIEQELNYQNFIFLNNLIENKDYELYSFYKVIDLLNSKSLKKSNLTPIQFLNKKIKSRKVVENIENNEDELPF